MFKKNYYTNDDLTSQAQALWDSIKSFKYGQDNFRAYENAIILPLIKSYTPLETYRVGIFEGGVCDENYNFLDGFYLKKDPHEPINLECIKSYRPESIKSVNETVIFAGYLTESFGLTITDGFTRLWYPILNTDNKNKIAFILRDDIDPFSSFHIKLLELLGISKDRVIIVTEPTRFKSVIVPKQAAYWFDSYDSELFTVPYDAARKSITQKKINKIYLSRSKFAENDIFNEEYFEQFFSSHGYKIIYPEQLELSEQIAYIAGADEIACTYGTLSHLPLFTKPNTKCIFLLRSSVLTVDLIRQQLINHSKHLDFVYIDVSLNLLPTFHDGYTGYIVGPSRPWQDFLKNELGIDENIDVYEYLNNLSLKLGDYVKLYMKRAMGRWFFQETFGYRFDYVSYIKSLYTTFAPENYENALNAMKTPGHPVFSNKAFKFINTESGNEGIIRLCANGDIYPLKGPTARYFMYWAYFKHRLIFMDKEFKPAVEFDMQDLDKAIQTKGVKVFQGRSVSGPFAAFILMTVSNTVPRLIIKCLVNKKRYKKLKRDPERFFNDSKCPVIRCLKRFYYY